MSDSQIELKHQLELEKMRKEKRKREENDTDTYSLTTRRTTQSQSCSVNGGHNGPPSPSQSSSRACQPGGSDTHERSMPVANKCEWKLGSSSLSGATLTDTAMRHLSKWQKIADLNTTVMQWVESTCG
jgi:hypothetical protein